MLKPQENDTLTRIGPGTPMGELLRRYWMPLAPKAEVDVRGLRPVRLLGEDLVLFRTKQGGYGLLDEHCSHRGASLCYGVVEEQGLRCPYHGWLYDSCGNILETPPEQTEAILNHVKHPSYKVQELGGVLFGYLGPMPVPLLPRYDILVRPEWVRRLEIHPALNCSWLQPMENAVDPSHLYWLHGYTGGARVRRDERSEFEPFEYGIYKYHYDAKHSEVHPLVFPHILRGPGNVMHMRIPMDDTHTGILYLLYSPTPEGGPADQEEVPYTYIGPIKEREDDHGYPRDRYPMQTFAGQDAMAWETQRQIANRSREHLGYSDKGVVLFRKMLLEQLDVVASGGDPLGVIRDPAENQCIELRVEEVDLATGQDIPYTGYDQRSFATPISARSAQRLRAD